MARFNGRRRTRGDRLRVHGGDCVHYQWAHFSFFKLRCHVSFTGMNSRERFLP